MINKIYIFDDIIDIESQNIIEEYALSTDLFLGGNNLEYLNIDDIQMPQEVLISPRISPDIQKVIKSIEFNSISKINKEILHTYRYKINRLKASDRVSDEYDKRGIHIDREQEHIAIVYYINNTDGDTFIYDTDLVDMIDWNNIVLNKEFERFTLRERVSPKKGRVVIFNGLLPHHSSYPTKSDRCVINFNTVIKTDPKTLF